MAAIVAAIAFLIGLIVRIVHDGKFDLVDVWIWLFIGLLALAIHAMWRPNWPGGRLNP